MSRWLIVWGVLLLFLMTACDSGGSFRLAGGEGGIVGTGDGSGSKSSIAGNAYKGPMLEGSEVRVFRVLENGQLKAVITTETFGAIAAFFLDLEEPGLFSVQVSGRYFDETSGQYATESVTLKAAFYTRWPEGLPSLAQPGLVQVNVLTDLVHDRALELIREGQTPASALSVAQEELLDFLSPLTGVVSLRDPVNLIALKPTLNPKQVIPASLPLSGDPDVVPPDMGGESEPLPELESETEASEESRRDSAFLAYISALLVESSPGKVQSWINLLEQDFVSDGKLSEPILASLQAGHLRLQPAQIELQLETLYQEDLPEVATTITPISDKLPAPVELASDTYVHSGTGQVIRRFYYNGSFQKPDDSVGGIEEGGDFIYELQVSQNDGFPVADTSVYFPGSNWFQRPGDDYDSGTWHYRVRKVWGDEQVSLWGTNSFLVE